MCLCINKAMHPIVTEKSGKQYFKPIVATEDIKVYKILRKREYGKNKVIYKNAYRGNIVKFNNEGHYIPEEFSRDEFIVYTSEDFSYYGYKEGFGYHAFLNAYRAIAEINLLLECWRQSTCFFEEGTLLGVFAATIPKGSIYYLGEFDGDICSNKIIITDIPIGNLRTSYYGEDGDITSNQSIIKLEIVDLNDN